jgi:hypothetical protein
MLEGQLQSVNRWNEELHDPAAVQDLFEQRQLHDFQRWLLAVLPKEQEATRQHQDRGQVEGGTWHRWW